MSAQAESRVLPLVDEILEAVRAASVDGALPRQAVLALRPRLLERAGDRTLALQLWLAQHELAKAGAERLAEQLLELLSICFADILQEQAFVAARARNTDGAAAPTALPRARASGVSIRANRFAPRR